MENATHRTAEQIKILRLLAKEYPGIPGGKRHAGQPQRAL